MGIYETLENLLNPSTTDEPNGVSNYSKKARKKINSEIQRRAERKIGAAEYSKLEGYVSQNIKNKKLQEILESVYEHVGVAQYGFSSGSVDDEAMSGTAIMLGMHLYLSSHDYNLDKAWDNTCGSQIVVYDAVLEKIARYECDE